MNSNTAPAPPLSPDDALPPVEPPSTGFIVQLFVVPAVIVGLILLAWFLFNQVAQTRHTPTDYLRALERDTPARWQAAASVADDLQNPRRAELRRDAEFARQLAKMLERELQSGHKEAHDVRFQGFLCQALGKFENAEGLPALLQAAQTPPDEATQQLRRAALEGLALLASNNPPDALAANADLLPTLDKTAGDSEPQIRSATAFALGVIGQPTARDRAASLLTDAYPDVRYNAATGLARHGDARAVEVLVEMLDPENEAATSVEENASARDYKQAMVLANSLAATGQLLAANPAAASDPLRQAVGKLCDAQIDGKLRIAAEELSRTLAARAADQP